MLSIPFPQDVIDIVVDHLHDDVGTLKSCAAVCRSFLRPSQLHLFFTVRLGKSLSSKRLCDLINAKPTIAGFVRELFIDHDIDLGVGTAWFANDTRFLPNLLNAMHHLRLLSLRLPYILPWASLSIEMRSALVERFRSSSLEDIKLYQLVHIPISVMMHFAHVKRLTLYSVTFHDDSEDHSSFESALAFTRLEALDVRIMSGHNEHRNGRLFSQIRSVRLLSIRACHRDTLAIAQQVIHSSGRSVTSLMWHYSGIKEIPLHLGLIHNLKYLILTMELRRRRESEFIADLCSLVPHFEDYTVTKALKELTVAVTPIFYPNWDSAVAAISTCSGWAGVDTALCDHVSGLERVYIFVEHLKSMPVGTNVQTQARLSHSLPRLKERGILSIGAGDIHELRDRVWSQAE